MEEFSYVEKGTNVQRSLKRDINLLMNINGIDAIFEAVTEEDLLREMVTDWVTKELAWLRAKKVGTMLESLNFKIYEEKFLRFQRETSTTARNSRQDLSTAVSVLTNTWCEEVHEKLISMEKEFMKWSRPKGNFLKWQSSHTQEFLEYDAPTGLDWEIGRSFLQLSFPGSTIKYKKLSNFDVALSIMKDYRQLHGRGLFETIYKHIDIIF